MHVIVRCVYEEYQLLKNYVKKKKIVIKIMKTILILSLCKLCIKKNVFVESWAGIWLGAWKKIIMVKIY